MILACAHTTLCGINAFGIAEIAKGIFSCAEQSRVVRSWEIVGYASGYDNRTSLILFRHPGVNALVQCGILYDVTRAPRTVVNCYELR